MDDIQSSIAVSTRVRLARNYADLPFPVLAEERDVQLVLRRVQNALEGHDFRVIPLHTLEPVDRQVLVERHLISPDLLHAPERAALAINPEGTTAIMVNEEDHLRIQAILPGLQLEQAYRQAGAADDLLETHGFAYHDTYGYLTSCPTNAGTGMRASIMMHLPALTMTGYMNTLAGTLNKVGLMIRGIYGEGSEALGNLYQISNQITLGPTEEDLLRNLALAAGHITRKELEARKLVRTQTSLEDRLWRAYGVLTHARRLDTQEFMKLLSDMRLGIDIGIFPITVHEINQLTTQGQAANLQRMSSRELSSDERDIERAELCRKTLKRTDIE